MYCPRPARANPPHRGRGGRGGTRAEPRAAPKRPLAIAYSAFTASVRSEIPASLNASIWK